MKRWLPAVLATGVLLALLLAFLDLGLGEVSAAVGDSLARLSLPTVALALLVYTGSYFGRALRFAILLPGVRGLVHLATIASRHNFLNLVLPFRSGELALPWMLHREAGRTLAEGAAALLVSRVLDLFCVAAFLCIGLAWYGVGEGTSAEVAPRVVAVFVGLALLLALIRPGARFTARLLGDREDGRIRGFLVRTARHLGGLSSARMAAATLTSLATWLLTYTTFYVIVRAMAGDDPVGLEMAGVTFDRSLVGTTGLHLSTVLPVNTVGGLGSWELGWVSGYVLLAGLDKQAAAVSAVVTHLLIFVFITLVGGLGFALRRRVAPPAEAPAP